MKQTIPTMAFLFCTALSGHAQLSTTNYALPVGATDVANNVLNMQGSTLTLSEGGNIPGESKSTCDGGLTFSTVGFVLQHYYDKQQLQQVITYAYAPLGGKKAMFIKSMKEAYDNENSMQAGATKRKEKLIVEEIQGTVVAHYAITYTCDESASVKTTATRNIYYLMLLTDADDLTISIDIYASADQARKYAEEILAKVKALDFEAVK